MYSGRGVSRGWSFCGGKIIGIQIIQKRAIKKKIAGK